MVDLEFSVLPGILLGGLDGTQSACMQENWVHLWIGNIPWRREWQLNPVFLPAEFHGQKRLEGYNPCGHSQTCMKDEYFDFSILPALIMFRQDCVLSAMRIFTPDHVLCT